VVKVR
jgi:hypothetical protein